MIDDEDLDAMLLVLEYDSQHIRSELEALADEGGFVMDQDRNPNGDSPVGVGSLGRGPLVGR